MKKLLLTVAISGLMTTGAFAIKGEISTCMKASYIADKQKEEGNKEEFLFTVEEHGITDVWKVTGAKTAAKALTGARVGWSDDAGIEIECTYDNGLTAKLIKKNCENGYK